MSFWLNNDGFNVNIKKSDLLKELKQKGLENVLERAESTTAEEEASIHGDLKNPDSNTNNKASTTVILSDDYGNRNVDSNGWTDKSSTVDITNDCDTMAEILIKGYDGKPLAPQEANSAMWSIVDNNRWMIDDINQTYLSTQVANDLLNVLENDSHFSDENMSALVEGITSGEITKDNLADYVDEANMDAVGGIFDKISNNEYQQFDKDIRTDQIPPELIAMTSFSSNEVNNGEIFIPDINTLIKTTSELSPRDDEETLSANVDVKSNEDVLFEDEPFKMTKNEDGTYTDGVMTYKTEEEAKAAAKVYIQNQIAQNYGLEDTNSDYVTDLANSYAGMGVLAALVKEEGNNEIFDKIDENPDAILDAMVNAAMSEDGLKLYCPDTEINALYTEDAIDDMADGTEGFSQADVEAFLKAEGNVKEHDTITYIHSLTDSLVPHEYTDKNGEVQEVLMGGEILAAYGMPVPLTNDSQELALSVFEQVLSNNPDVANAIIGGDESTYSEMSTKEKLELLMGTNFAQAVNDAGGQLVLENVQYIVNDAPIITPTQAPTEVPTEPAPTEPVPTEPVPTEPVPTEPVPTVPVPTVPVPTVPLPTLPDIPEPTIPTPTIPTPTIPTPTCPEITLPDLPTWPSWDLPTIPTWNPPTCPPKPTCPEPTIPTPTIPTPTCPEITLPDLPTWPSWDLPTIPTWNPPTCPPKPTCPEPTIPTPTIPTPTCPTPTLPDIPTWNPPTCPPKPTCPEPTIPTPTIPTPTIPTPTLPDLPTWPSWDLPTIPTWNPPTCPPKPTCPEPTIPTPTIPTPTCPTPTLPDLPTWPSWDLPTIPTWNPPTCPPKPTCPEPTIPTPTIPTPTIPTPTLPDIPTWNPPTCPPTCPPTNPPTCPPEPTKPEPTIPTPTIPEPTIPQPTNPPVTECPTLPEITPSDTPLPTQEPTMPDRPTPTEAPTMAPTVAPTEAPTMAPTEAPTMAPTNPPVDDWDDNFDADDGEADFEDEVPDVPTQAPTMAPTVAPTEAPTMAPTEAPTMAPTEAPTMAPTEAPDSWNDNFDADDGEAGFDDEEELKRKG